MWKAFYSIAIVSVVVQLWAVTAYSAERQSGSTQLFEAEAMVMISQPEGNTPPVDEVTLAPQTPDCDVQLASILEQQKAQESGQAKELARLKKEVLDITTLNTEKDKTIFAVRGQAAEALTKLAAQQSSVESEVFRLLSERATRVKLRGFGGVELVPLLNDYLVVIAPEQAKEVDSFFAKIRKVVVTGKSGTYLICDRKYFVSVASPAESADTGEKR